MKEEDRKREAPKNRFVVSAIAYNKNQAEFMAGELERMGCTGIEITGGEDASC